MAAPGSLEGKRIKLAYHAASAPDDVVPLLGLI